MKLSIIIAFVLITNSLFACICWNPTVEEASENAKEIFLGRVINIEQTPIIYKTETKSSEYYVQKFTFEVIQKWKGSKQKQVIIYGTGGNCDINFSVDSVPILVYAWVNKFFFEENRDSITTNDKMTAQQCSRTIREGERTRDYWFDSDTVLLNQKFPNFIQLEIPIEISNPIELPNRPFNWYWIIISGILLLGFALILNSKHTTK